MSNPEELVIFRMSLPFGVDESHYSGCVLASQGHPSLLVPSDFWRIKGVMSRFEDSGFAP